VKSSSNKQETITVRYPYGTTAKADEEKPLFIFLILNTDPKHFKDVNRAGLRIRNCFHMGLNYRFLFVRPPDVPEMANVQVPLLLTLIVVEPEAEPQKL
jgi:hypothetical protein